MADNTDFLSHYSSENVYLFLKKYFEDHSASNNFVSIESVINAFRKELPDYNISDVDLSNIVSVYAILIDFKTD